MHLHQVTAASRHSRTANTKSPTAKSKCKKPARFLHLHGPGPTTRPAPFPVGAAPRGRPCTGTCAKCARSPRGKRLPASRRKVHHRGTENTEAGNVRPQTVGANHHSPFLLSTAEDAKGRRGGRVCGTAKQTNHTRTSNRLLATDYRASSRGDAETQRTDELSRRRRGGKDVGWVLNPRATFLFSRGDTETRRRDMNSRKDAKDTKM